MKSVIKLALPQIKSKVSLHVKLDNKYYTREKYLHWESRGFKMDPFYFQGNRIHKLKCSGYFGKKPNKQKLLKIKLLSDEPISSPEDLENLSDLFPLKQNVIIFVTGGGFVSDFEKLAQFYLREISKDLSMPVFIIKYRFTLTPESPLSPNSHLP